MKQALYQVALPPEILERGFWLYAWAIALKTGETVYYVGRTGDFASPRAQSPFSRISGHLGSNKHANALQRHLRRHNIKFEECESLEFVAHGPLEDEASDWDSHKLRRDRTHALERDLCEAMTRAGYRVLNKVDCLTPTDGDAWKPVRHAFAQRFDRLSTV